MSRPRGAAARRGFGSVEVLGSGRWRARYRGADDRLRSAPVTFATAREAEAWLITVHADLLRGVWVDPLVGSVTVAEYAQTWQRQHAHRLRPRTRDLYARLAERWITAPVGHGPRAVHLGPLPLHTLSAALIREWFAAVLTAAAESATARAGRTDRTHPARAWANAAGLSVAPTGRLSPAVLTAWRRAGSPDLRARAQARPDAGRTTAAQAYRFLHAVLTEAVTDGLIPTNPARIPGAGHVTHPERLPLSVAEVNALAAEMPERYRAAVLVAAWSGLRPGEVFALRRRDVDLEAGTVTVRASVMELPGQPPTFGPPKTQAGRRTVALPAFVTHTLTTHLHTFTAPGPDALVFTTTAGAVVTATTRAGALRGPRARIGRPDVTWHHLRHTGATLAAQAGATQAELQRRIGHASPRAAALYQHATTERDTALAHALHTLATTPKLSVVRGMNTA